MGKRRPPSPEKTGQPELRPVGARALKSTIDTLRPYLFGARVLDLFAGQGRFGIASLIEEAEHADFVERDKKSAAQIDREIPKDCKGEVHCEDVFKFLREATGAPYDIIFADPPFPLWEDEPFGHELVHAIVRVAAKECILVLKVPSRLNVSAEPPDFVSWKIKEFGESNLLFFRKEA